jgi:two-component system, NtrC family, sensor kinase
MGCPLAQGYFWCRPVPPEEFPSVVRTALPSPADASAPPTPDPQVVEQAEHMGWAALDALPTAVAVIGAAGTIVATNFSWKRFALEHGGDASSCGVGVNYLAVCERARGSGAEDAAMAGRGLRAVLTGDRDSFSLEYDGSDANGQRRFLMLVSPVAAGAGAAVVAHVDITDRHIAEQALADSEERFHSIFDQAPLGIFRLDNDGRIVDANRTLCDLVGRPRTELFGSHRTALFYDAEQPRPDAGGAPERATDGEDGPRSSHRLVRRPDGTVRTVQVNDVVVDDKRGGSHTLVATLEDITDRLRLSEDLRRAQEMEALGRLAGGIAHEINTPTQFISDNLAFLANIWPAVAEVLGAAQGAVGRLRAGEAPGDVAAGLEAACQGADLDFVEAEVPSALSQSQDGVHRVATIVRAMKAFGHPDRDDPEPTDINRLVANTITVAQSEIKYVADVATDLGDLPVVMCYQGAVGQVVLNLLVNAAYVVGKSLELSGQRGQIGIRTWLEDAQACIAISDTGPGIPKDVLPQIFEPFFTTKPLGQGTGQGLAMAWATIVDRHRGRIDVATSEAGTTFVVRLPVGADPDGAKAGEIVPPSQT